MQTPTKAASAGLRRAQLMNPLPRAGRPRQDRLALHPALQVFSERRRGFVTPTPVLFQCLHHHPIHFPPHQAIELVRGRLTARRHLGQLILAQRGQPGRRAWAVRSPG